MRNRYLATCLLLLLAPSLTAQAAFDDCHKIGFSLVGVGGTFVIACGVMLAQSLSNQNGVWCGNGPTSRCCPTRINNTVDFANCSATDLVRPLQCPNATSGQCLLQDGTFQKPSTYYPQWRQQPTWGIMVGVGGFFFLAGSLILSCRFYRSYAAAHALAVPMPPSDSAISAEDTASGRSISES